MIQRIRDMEIKYEKKERDPGNHRPEIVGFTCKVDNPQQFGFEDIQGQAEIVQKTTLINQKQTKVNQCQYTWGVKGIHRFYGELPVGQGAVLKASIYNEDETYNRHGRSETAEEANEMILEAIRSIIEKRPDRYYEQIQDSYNDTHQGLLEFLEIKNNPEMPRTEDPAPITCYIQVDPRKIPDLRRRLQQLGIKFHPHHNLLVWDDESMELSHLRGEMIPILVERINQYLDRNHLEPKLPPYQEEWTPEQCNELLQMAIIHFQWLCSNELERDHWKGDPKEWAGIVEQHTTVFQE